MLSDSSELKNEASTSEKATKVDPGWIVRSPEGGVVGPVSLELLQRGVNLGRVPQASLVAPAGTEDWQPLLDLLAEKAAPSQPARDAASAEPAAAAVVAAAVVPVGEPSKDRASVAAVAALTAAAGAKVSTRAIGAPPPPPKSSSRANAAKPLIKLPSKPSLKPALKPASLKPALKPASLKPALKPASLKPAPKPAVAAAVEVAAPVMPLAAPAPLPMPHVQPPQYAAGYGQPNAPQSHAAMMSYSQPQAQAPGDWGSAVTNVMPRVSFAGAFEDDPITIPKQSLTPLFAAFGATLALSGFVALAIVLARSLF